MRLTTVILIAAIMQVSASGFAQKISLNKSNASLEQIIKDLRKQSGFDFIVIGELLDQAKSVNIKVKDAAFEKVLDQIFENQQIAYEINNNTVTLKAKPKGIFERMVDQLMAIDVSGKVVDSLTGEPLPGATILIKGKKQMIRTATDGTFSLQNVEEDALLVITHTGYKTRELKPVKNLGLIRMAVAVSNLQEVGVVVNTGYQRIKPEQSTGAVSQITTKAYESRISTSFLDGLVNRLPGLMINNDVNFTSTVPGSTGSNSRALFNIRGISTMSANQNPLIVIDGFPTELTLDMIDPNEIKSVTILKDAAAATVYGVRASNGVIVIERKQAAQGKTSFNFRTTTGLTPKEDYSRYRWADDASAVVANYQRTTQLSNVNAGTWGLLATGTATTGGTVQRTAPYYILAQAAANMITPDQAASAFNDLTSYNNTDDYSSLFLRQAVTKTYNFNASGGNENALYYITANYTGNQQSRRLNDNNRLLLSGRTTFKISRRLSLELTTDYQEQRSSSAPTIGITEVAPYARFQDENGDPLSIVARGISPTYNNVLMSQGMDDQLYYPLVEMNEVNDKTRTTNNRTTVDLKYNIGKGFDLNLRGIYESSNSDSRHDASDLSQESRRYVNSYVVRNTDGTYKYNVPKGGFLRQQTNSTSSYTARTQLNYNKEIGVHSFNGIVGAEVRNLIDKGFTTSSFGYNEETLLQQPIDYTSLVNGTIRGSFNLGSPLATQSVYDNLFNRQYNEDRFLSGYANGVYSYKNTYSVSGSIRIDQSNLFGTNPKYKYKPLWSVGGAWNIHKEEFMQGLNWVNQLKLRAAYGFNGNVAKLSLPEVIARAVLNANTSPSSQSLRLLSYANTSLRWEQTQNFNTGLDFNIFKNISGSLDYYRKKSTDLLGSAQIDPTLGVSPTLINQATINNNGIELSLHADWIATGKTNWNTGLVIARNTSKVLEVYQKADFSPQTLNQLGYVKNYPVGAMFSYRYAGLDAEGYPLIKDGAGTQYRTNVNSLGNATAAAMASATSDVSYYSGSSIPTINAGLSNRVDIGSFYVFAMINYYGGFKVRIPRAAPNVLRPLEGAGSYWKTAGDENTTTVMGLAGFASANSNNAYNYSDNYVVSGDYITLGDLTASYSFDQLKFVNKIGLKHLEIKAQASNIWTVGMNRENFSMATGSYQKSYLTPTYTLALFTTF
ncbi:SusC/RagA family TonB-linked outer membrane protein [Pedobacter metabolipauper]|nr:SusC/RagA family TonB-linked outer membrane protein [Pedobacter metabolipauper]